MKKIISILLLGILYAPVVIGQPSFNCGYVVSADTTPYTTIVGISGGGSKWSAVPMDDIAFRNIPMFMNFNFNGVTYNSISISSNGYLWFGTGNTAVPYTANPLSVANLGTNVAGVIVPCGRDLIGHPDLVAPPVRIVNGSGQPYSIYTLLSGTAPNRVTTIEWVGFYPKGLGSGNCGAVSDNHRLDFQVKLHENNPSGIHPNRIEMLYRDQTPFCTDQPYTFAMGIRGVSDTDYVNRTQSSGNLTATSTSAGTSNTDLINFLGGDHIVGTNPGLNLVFDYTTASSVAIAASAPVICPGVPVTFTATPNNGGTTPKYQWKVNGQSVGTDTAIYSNNNLNNGDTVTCEMISSAACASGTPVVSNRFVVTYSSVVAAVTIVVSDSNVCAGQNVIFTAQPSNGGTAPVYQWKVNGFNTGTDSFLYQSNALTDGDIVTCEMTSNAACVSGAPATSNAIELSTQVNAVLVASIVASDNSICTGTPVTFSAGSVNGGDTPTYQWYVNETPVGVIDTVYTSSGLRNGDKVSCVVTSSKTCVTNPVDTSNIITMTVSDLAIAGTITALEDTVCEGATVRLTISDSSGIVQWQSGLTANALSNIPAANSSVYVTAPLAEPTYFRVYVSNGACSDTSAPYSVMVKPNPLPPAVSGDAIFCSGDSAILCVPASYASYNWNIGGASPCITARQAGNYWVTVTAQNGCSVTSARKSVSVYSPTSVSIVVQGDTLSSFNALQYQWYRNGQKIEGATTATYIVTQSGSYSVQVTDANGCKTMSSQVNIDKETGLYDIASDTNFILYPNPTTGYLQVEMNGAWQREYEVYDVCGKLIANGTALNKNFSIDLSQASSGIYYVKLNGAVRKVLKN